VHSLAAANEAVEKEMGKKRRREEEKKRRSWKQS
jgi:hypothetical protein